MNIERDRLQAMDLYGIMDPETLEDYIASQETGPAAEEVLGKTATNQTAIMNLDAEYEAHCVPNGD